MRVRSLYLRLLWVVVFAYLGVGICWTAVNLGDIPHYGDTETYFRFAQDLEVTEHRGIAYPWLLAGAVDLLLDGERPGPLYQKQEEREAGRSCAAPKALLWFQVFQMVVGALALLLFLWLTLGGGARGGVGRGGSSNEFVLLFLLLFFDPLLNHYNLALMTDGLAFAACLVFCGTLTALVERRPSPWPAGVVLVGAFLLAAGLRVEKKWVLLATFALVFLLWLAAGRRAPFPAGWQRRVGLAGLFLVGALAWIVLIHGGVATKKDALSSYEAFAHFRIGLPYLSEVYEELPERTRAQLSRQDAVEYDSHVNGVRRVVQRVAGSEALTREEFTADVLATVLPRHGVRILFDVVRDALENTFSTVSLYARVAAWHLGGDGAIDRWFYSDGTIWNYQRMAFHHPRWTAASVGLAGLLLLLALPAAFHRLRTEQPSTQVVLLWAPCLVFSAVNGVFFAAAFNYVNVRYALVAHGLCLLLVFRPAVRTLLGIEETS